MSIGECRLLVRLYFPSSAQHVLLVTLGWFVRWEVSGRTLAVLWSATFRFCSKQHAVSLSSFHQAFVWKNSRYILSERLDFHTVVNSSIAVYAFPLHMFILLSVDEILLPRYVKRSTHFSGLPFNEEMSPSWLKDMNSVLFDFTSRPMLLAVYCRLFSKDLTRAGVYTKSVRSSV